MAEPSPEQQEINTFIFLDTEATGLPSPGNKTRVTEISLVAYSRKELMTKTKHPRVCNKLTLCFDPCRPIQPQSSEISGLHNDALEGLPTFKKQSPLIVSFLKSLPPSVCLVAHNGNNFDFPLLKAELKRSQHHEEIDTILCADSLWVFRNLDGLPAVPPALYANQANKQKLPHKAEEDGKDHSFNLNGNRLNSNAISNSNNVSNSFYSNNTSSAFNSSVVPGMMKHEMTPGKISVRNEPPNPQKRGSNDVHYPDSSVKKRLFVAGSDSSSNWPQQDDRNTTLDQDNSSNSSNPVQNVPAKQNNTIKQKTLKSYSLPKLYKEYFGQEPDVSHTAEDDCITLVKIVRLKAEEFLAWCNQNAVPFKNIHSMY